MSERGREGGRRKGREREQEFYIYIYIDTFVCI